MCVQQRRSDLVYLDHAASTPWRAEARAAFDAAIDTGSANASGSHRAARRARALVEDARDELADVVGVDAGSVVFTSGGTESDDLAVFGRHAAVGGTVLCTAVEHPAVLEAVNRLGGKVVGCDRSGVIDLEQLASLLDGDVRLVSVMTVNNEVGTVQPIIEVAELVRDRAPAAGVHTDAVQALTWLDLRAVSPHVDLMSLSAHKIGGPQGVGALIVSPDVAISARHVGGGQERERRSGTHNVAGIVAMAAAARAADRERAVDVARIGGLRDRLVDRIVAEIPDVARTTAHDAAVAGFAHLCFGGLESEELLFLLDDAGVCASAASACASGAQQSSHVLAAMGVAPDLARGSLRLTLGHTTTVADVDAAAAAVIGAAQRLQAVAR